MDGGHNSTIFTDSSSYANTVTNVSGIYGQSKQTTAVSKFGGCSGGIYNDSYLSIPSSELFDFGGGSFFTVEYWFRLENTSNSDLPFVSQRITSGFTPFELRVVNTNIGWRIGNAALNGWASTAVDSGSPVSQGIWYHLALTGDGSNLRLFLNGDQRLSVAQPSWSSANRPFYIGRTSTNTSYGSQFDELRVTKFVAHYTSNFTPPTSAFPNSY
jgi:hypothetical protein